MKPFYLLKWNDEYLDMQIIGGPFDNDKAAKSALMEETITRLTELDVAENKEDAGKLYAETEKHPDQETEALHISGNGASIFYGSGYEERYQIVEY